MMRIIVIIIIAEYVRRVRKLCRSKLNGGNLLASMPELKVWYATVQISWIGQWKNWSAWIGKLER